MIAENWVQIDVRLCARGYSVSLLKGLHVTHDRPFVITLNLDGIPYWAYPDLKELEALPAMDDLETSPGPRGDSSWLAVLDRCRKGVKSPESHPSPSILTDKVNSSVGTWQWIQQLRANRVRT